MTRTAWVAAVAVLVGLAGSARAEVVATFIGTDPFQTVNVSGTNSSGPRAFQSPVGVFNFVVQSDTSNTGLSPAFSSFCADYFQDVSLGGVYSYTPVAFTALPDINGDAVKTRKVQQLFDRYYGGVNDSETAAAFQLSLWEILYDPTNTDLSSGNFTASGDAIIGTPSGIATAQGWLNSIADPNVPDVAKRYDLLGLLNGEFQDQILARPVETVPAPAGVVLLLVGAAGLIARRRKFAAKKDAEPTTEAAAA